MANPNQPFERHIPLTGGHNFRDMGGYPTSDGRQVARGRIYRSGTLSELTDEDHLVMDRIGLRLICDLRSTNERERRPSRIPPAARFEIWSRDHEMSAGDLMRILALPEASAPHIRDAMIAAYRKLPYEQAPSYRVLFSRIAEGDLPVLFHCAAGKDRTGIAAALLLTLLGVERDVIVDDYALTDRFFERGCELVTKDPIGNRFTGIDRAIWAPMMRADPDYLMEMFDTLDQRHGSVRNFLIEILELEQPVLDRIVERLVE